MIVPHEAQYSFDALGPAYWNSDEIKMSGCEVVADVRLMHEINSGIAFEGD